MNSILHFATFFFFWQKVPTNVYKNMLHNIKDDTPLYKHQNWSLSSIIIGCFWPCVKYLQNNRNSLKTIFIPLFVHFFIYYLFILLQGKLEEFEGGKAAHGLLTRLVLNPLWCGVQMTCQNNTFFFQKVSKCNFHCHVWTSVTKCIPMSTNKPTFGPVVLEIVLHWFTGPYMLSKVSYQNVWIQLWNPIDLEST